MGDEIDVNSLSSQSCRTASTPLTLEGQEAMGAFQGPRLRKTGHALSCYRRLPQVYDDDPFLNNPI